MPTSRVARWFFWGALGAWCCVPFLQWNEVALDVLPLVAGGKVARTDARALYSEANRTTEATHDELSDAACGALPEGADCRSLRITFTQPPPAIPFSEALDALGLQRATLLMRLLGVASLATGLVMLARRFDPASEHAQLALAATAVLLIPLVWNTTRYGQTSPMMFLSAAIGMNRRERGGLRDASRSLLLAFTVVMKAFPVALTAVLGVQRQWRKIAWTIAWLAASAVVTLLLVPSGVFGDFARSSRSGLSVAASDWSNISLDGVFNYFGDWHTEGLAYTLSLPVRAGVLAWLWLRRVRLCDEDFQWGYGWLAILLLIPVVWLHYLWLVIAAAVLAIVSRRDRDRSVMVLPALAGLLAALVALGESTALSLAAGSTFWIIAIFAIPFLARERVTGIEPA